MHQQLYRYSNAAPEELSDEVNGEIAALLSYLVDNESDLYDKEALVKRQNLYEKRSESTAPEETSETLIQLKDLQGHLKDLHELRMGFLGDC